MKKTFTLIVTALLLLTGLANAQNYRKWDFTSWSATTIANLLAEDAAGGVSGAGWSSTEKANGDNPQPNNCYWSYVEANVADGVLQANGAAIAETEGLVFNPAYAAKRNLAIAVNYPSTTLGDYAGPQYLWLGGGNAKSASARIVCFTIPKVKIGQKITFVAESHKPADARGVALYVGSATDDANQIGEAFKPKAQESYTWENWTIPEGAATNTDGTVDILVVNTNGCHIYSIEVGDNTQKSKIAYLYEGTPDATQGYAASLENYDVESIDVTTTTKTAEELRAYDAVVVASNVTAWGDVLNAAIAWTPIINTSYALYDIWNFGKSVKQSENLVIINKKGHALFNGIETIDDPDSGVSAVAMEGDVYAIQDLNNYFVDDDMVGIGMDGADMITAHIHNTSHNAYMYVPAGNQQLILNAIKIATNSKAEVTAAPKPTIKFEYGNMKTKVIITSSVPRTRIYYTTDGSEPAQTVYSMPFWIEKEATIKAVAEGNGYLRSEVAEATVVLKQQASQPIINVRQENGASIVTLEGTTEGASIFYNYSASNDSTKSTKYTGPITIIKERELTAFAASQDLVASEPVTQNIPVENPMTFTETLAHMDAAKEPYYSKQYDLQNAGEAPNTDSSSKVAYFFSWGKTKTKYPYYDTSADPISTTEDPETGDPVNVYPKNAEEKFDFENGWAVRSRGQVICSEITIKPGVDLGNTASYNPATVDEYEFSEDYPCTDFYLNLSEWNTNGGDPRSAMIYTTQKFKGPFAILSYISNGNGGTGPSVVFETGTDIEGDATETEWNLIGDTCELNQGQRLYKKFIRVYSGTDEVYVRARHAAGGSKAGFYDIYILGMDSQSPYFTGIEQVKNTVGKKSAAVYGINGARRSSMQRGLNIVIDEQGTAKKVMK